VIYLHGKHYLSRTGAVPIEINSSLGNPFWQENAWWITLGRTLFKVNTATIPAMGDLFITTAGQFGFRASAGDGQKVVIQASEDLVTWANLQTNTVSGGSFIFKDDGSGGLGHQFYRIVTR
jgi:hypothetical protein